MEEIFEVRDRRIKEKFYLDDLYLNGYAKKCGIYATGVYMSLCRHANKEQKCWPSIKKIAEELLISETQARRSLKILVQYNIISIQRLGKKLNNRYYLLDKSEWYDRTVTQNTSSPSECPDRTVTNSPSECPDRTVNPVPQDTHPLYHRTLHSKGTQFKETHSNVHFAPQGVREDSNESLKEPSVKEDTVLLKEEHQAPAPAPKSLTPIASSLSEQLALEEEKNGSAEAKQIVEIISIFRQVSPFLKYGNKTQRQACQELIGKFSFESVKQLAQVAVAINGKEFAPTIATPLDLTKKISNLKAYVDRQNTGGKMGGKKRIYEIGKSMGLTDDKLKEILFTN